MTEDRLDQEGGASRRHMLGVGAVAALAGLGAAWWHWQPAQTLPEAIQDWWSRSFEQPTGGVLAVSTLRGHPLLLNFWATWCAPCVEELPMLDAFWRQNSPKGIQVLGLAVDQPSNVRRYLERTPLGFPVALAGLEGMELTRALGNAAGGLPFSVFFDEDGSIWKQKLGQLKVQDMQEWRSHLDLTP